MRESKTGKVLWITGLAGAGKTTVCRLLTARLRQMDFPVVSLDGDLLRSMLGVEKSYSLEERKHLAMTYCRLCKMLAEDGHDVIIATISMFHECHEWNRRFLPDYYEIYLKASEALLKKRNQKNLYEIDTENVVGITLPFEEPKHPHLVLSCDQYQTPEELEQDLYRALLDIRAIPG